MCLFVCLFLFVFWGEGVLVLLFVFLNVISSFELGLLRKRRGGIWYDDISCLKGIEFILLINVKMPTILLAF